MTARGSAINRSARKLPDLRLFPHMKHINEIGREDQRRAKEIMTEIKEIFERILRLSKEQTSGELADLKRLQEEIEKLGYAFTSEIKVSSHEGELSIKADLRLYTSKCKTQTVN